jgi:hypothetical protein
LDGNSKGLGEYLEATPRKLGSTTYGPTTCPAGAGDPKVLEIIPLSSVIQRKPLEFSRGFSLSSTLFQPPKLLVLRAEVGFHEVVNLNEVVFESVAETVEGFAVVVHDYIISEFYFLSEPVK